MDTGALPFDCFWIIVGLVEFCRVTFTQLCLTNKYCHSNNTAWRTHLSLYLLNRNLRPTDWFSRLEYIDLSEFLQIASKINPAQILINGKSDLSYVHTLIIPRLRAQHAEGLIIQMPNLSCLQMTLSNSERIFIEWAFLATRSRTMRKVVISGFLDVPLGYENLEALIDYFPNLEYLEADNTFIRGGTQLPSFNKLPKLRTLRVDLRDFDDTLLATDFDHYFPPSLGYESLFVDDCPLAIRLFGCNVLYNNSPHNQKFLENFTRLRIKNPTTFIHLVAKYISYGQWILEDLARVVHILMKLHNIDWKFAKLLFYKDCYNHQQIKIMIGTLLVTDYF